MKVKGRYEIDQNYLNIYTHNTLYTIARNNGEWGTSKLANTSLVAC